MHMLIESTSTELFRVMECIRKTRTDTKGAVHVALGAVWFDLEKMANENFIDLSTALDDISEHRMSEELLGVLRLCHREDVYHAWLAFNKKTEDEVRGMLGE